MLFISTSTFPYFSELLARANVQIYELNEEENETHNSNSKNKIGNYLTDFALSKILASLSSTIIASIYQLKQHNNYYPETTTPPPEHTLIR